MKIEVHRALTDLSRKMGKEYGKLVQKLLAIAFLEAGAEDVSEQSTQGTDLKVRLAGNRLAVEVKTAEDGEVRLQKKDLEGLAAREHEGARAYLAVLGLRLLDEWVFARFYSGELQPAQNYSVTQLRPYRDSELEGKISDTFPAAVLKHAGTASRGQGALDEVLKSYRSYRIA